LKGPKAAGFRAVFAPGVAAAVGGATGAAIGRAAGSLTAGLALPLSLWLAFGLLAGFSATFFSQVFSWRPFLGQLFAGFSYCPLFLASLAGFFAAFAFSSLPVKLIKRQKNNYCNPATVARYPAAGANPSRLNPACTARGPRPCAQQSLRNGGIEPIPLSQPASLPQINRHTAKLILSCQSLNVPIAILPRNTLPPARRQNAATL
jgi:hypothetical protein